MTQWTLGAMDGLTSDSQGTLWAAAAGGVIVVDPSTGEHLVTLQVGVRAGNVVSTVHSAIPTTTLLFGRSLRIACAFRCLEAVGGCTWQGTTRCCGSRLARGQ